MGPIVLIIAIILTVVYFQSTRGRKYGKEELHRQKLREEYRKEREAKKKNNPLS